MKLLSPLVIAFLIFSCQKKEFQSCPEYEKLIGTWESINGDSEYEITYGKEGVVVEKSDFERTERYKIKQCSYKNLRFKMEIYHSKAFTRGCKTNITIDTISLLMGAYNQPIDTVDYFIYFTKKK